MALFESEHRRMPQITPVLEHIGLASLQDARQLCESRGVDVYGIVKGIQPICFENACWAYILGAAMAIKKGQTKAVDIARTLGEGLQAFCIPGSVADERKVGIGHGNLASMLLLEETKCFAFLAGHESFAAAEGAIGLARSANRARQEPLRVILNGLGKDAAQIISRINGNSTNPTRFQHPVAGTYKKECLEQGKRYFSVASGGGTGRTLHPDNMAAGPASYGMTDTMGRMHSDAQFAGSSSVPAHVEMMGFLGMGNNPMVGASVAVAVALEHAS